MAGGWGRPGLHKLTCYITPALRASLRVESVQREMSVGELIEEAFSQRPTPAGTTPKVSSSQTGMVLSRTSPIGVQQADESKKKRSG